jgi:hypothetical protein
VITVPTGGGAPRSTSVNPVPTLNWVPSGS